jgi:signal transduction histidine kinase
MHLKVKHIFIICALVLVLATVVLSALNANYVRNANLHRATMITSALIQIHNTYVHTFNHQSQQSKENFTIRQGQFDLTLAPTPPTDPYYELTSAPISLSPYNFNLMARDLLIHGHIIAASYFAPTHQWLTITARLDRTPVWDNVIPIFLVEFTAMLIIWVCFLLFYHYTLPQEVMDLLVGDLRSQRRNDQLIKNLRDHLQTYINERTIMITALAHDIKTPLTEAMLRLELLDDETTSAPIREKLEHIDNIVRSSLEYARQPDRIRKARTEVVSLIESVVDRYRDTDFEVVFTPYVGQFTMMVEVQLFKRMLINLIENARKYATTCQIIVNQPSPHTLEIICQDDGPGVPDEFLGLIAVPYFRADQARTSDKGGSGLGLAIVNKIVELHHGTMSFENQPGGGFCVTVHLDQRKQKRLSKTEKLGKEANLPGPR